MHTGHDKRPSRFKTQIFLCAAAGMPHPRRGVHNMQIQRNTGNAPALRPGTGLDTTVNNSHTSRLWFLTFLTLRVNSGTNQWHREADEYVAGLPSALQHWWREEVSLGLGLESWVFGLGFRNQCSPVVFLRLIADMRFYSHSCVRVTTIWCRRRSMGRRLVETCGSWNISRSTPAFKNKDLEKYC